MTLRSVYEDTLTSTRDPALLAERAGVTVKSAQTFLRDEASAQVSRQRRKPTADNYAPTGAPQGYWQYIGRPMLSTLRITKASTCAARQFSLC